MLQHRLMCLMYLLEKQLVDKHDFMEANDKIYDKKYVEDPGESESLQAGQLVSVRQEVII